MRQGVTLVELLIVLALVSILAAIAVPRYGAVVTEAQATSIAADIRALSHAAHSYEIDHGDWPDEGPEGAVPDELAPYLPHGFAMRGRGYTLDWEKWSLPDGALLGVAVTTSNQRLGSAIGRAMRNEQANIQLEDRQTFFVGRDNGRS